jgi:hypothetical protein
MRLDFDGTERVFVVCGGNGINAKCIAFRRRRREGGLIGTGVCPIFNTEDNPFVLSL